MIISFVISTLNIKIATFVFFVVSFFRRKVQISYTKIFIFYLFCLPLLYSLFKNSFLDINSQYKFIIALYSFTTFIFLKTSSSSIVKIDCILLYILFIFIILDLFYNHNFGDRYTFYFERASQFSFFCVMSFFILLLKKGNVRYIFIIVLCFFTFFSGTKKELIFILIFIFSILFKAKNKSQLLILSVIISSSLYFIFFNFDLLDFLRVNKNIKEIGSRYYLINETLNIINNNYYGIGYGNWNAFLPEYGIDNLEFGGPHNGFLDFIGMFGFLFAPIYFIVYIYFFLYLRKRKYGSYVFLYVLFLEFFSISFFYSGDLRSFLILYYSSILPLKST